MLQNKLAQLLDQAGAYNRDGIVVTPYANDFIFQGRAFTIQRVLSVANTANTYVLLNLSASTYVIALPFGFKGEDGPFLVKFYEGTDYTGGTAVASCNRDLTSSTTTTVVCTSGATGSDKGTLKAEYLVGTGGTVLSHQGGSSKQDLPFILDTDKNYLLEIDNQSSTNPAQFEIGFTWYE